MKVVISVVVLIIFVIFLVVGVVGNGILIYIVFVNKCMRNILNVLIVSLFIGDMVLLLMLVLFFLIYFLYVEYFFGEVVCRSNEYF